MVDEWKACIEHQNVIKRGYEFAISKNKSAVLNELKLMPQHIAKKTKFEFF
jgi:hypothetical protein